MNSELHEIRLAEAVDAWNRGTFKKKIDCARAFDVKYKLFLHRLNGRLSRHERQPLNYRLESHEEEAILQFLETLANLGIHGSSHTIETLANHLLQLRDEKRQVGRNWTKRFFTRHAERIGLQRDSIKEIDRAAAEDPVELAQWYDEYKGILDRCGIQPIDIWNADQTGFRIGIGKTQKVVVRISRQRSRVSSATASEREVITLCECVNAVGDMIPPMIILRSRPGSHMEDWYRATSISQDYLIATSPTAYINDILALDWIRHFDQFTKLRQQGRWRLLLIDGNDSHKTYEFLRYCLDHEIIPFILRPHTTHICQPLDVSVFQPYKHYHGQEIASLHRRGVSHITKVDFLDMILSIRTSTFKASTIRSGFAKTGLWPYNPTIVLDQLQQNTSQQEQEEEEEEEEEEKDYDFATPKNRRQTLTLINAISRKQISPSTGSQRLYQSNLIKYNLIDMLKDQVYEMTAAQQHKKNINRSKRRIKHISGQPSSLYVATARKAVFDRIDKEKAKEERKKTRACEKEKQKQFAQEHGIPLNEVIESDKEWTIRLGDAPEPNVT
jgi:hypothetical protein